MFRDDVCCICEVCHKEKEFNVFKLCKECVLARKEKNKERIDLYVPYEDREFVKSWGAKWDNEKKLWYANHYLVNVVKNGYALLKYTSPNKKVYYNIPYSLKDKVKELGAKWDSSVKKWYVWSQNDTLYSEFVKYLDEKNDWEKMMYEE